MLSAGFLLSEIANLLSMVNDKEQFSRLTQVSRWVLITYFAEMWCKINLNKKTKAQRNL